MRKKGLIMSILIMMFVLFLFAIGSLIAQTLWNGFIDAVDGADNTTITPDVKEKINDFSSTMAWGDKLFIIFFLILMAGYMISSVTLPADKPIYFLIFFVMLVFITILAMILSNAWAYISTNPNFLEAAADLEFTDFFMKYFPIFTFLVGIIGAVLFYTRRQSGFNGGGAVDGFQ